MTDVKVELPKAQDVKWIDKQYTFTGEWMPDVDPSTIGPTNFAELQNFRYNDKSIEGVNGYTRINVFPNTCDVADGAYIKIRNGHQLRSNRTTNSRVLIQALDGSGNGKVFQNTGTIDTASDFDNAARLDVNGSAWYDDSSTNLEGRFSSAPQQSMIYCNGKENAIYSGSEHRMAACFQVTAAPTIADAMSPKDVTDKLNSSLTTEDSLVTIDAAHEAILVLTTRPAQGFNVYVETASTDGTADMAVGEWQGSSFVDLNATDNTPSVGEPNQTLQEDGTVTWTHSSTLAPSGEQTDVAKLFHYEELYLYAYLITFSGQASNVDAVLSQLTVDYAMGSLHNVWDGVYRQPIQFQLYKAANTAYEDYTLHVNESSDVNLPVGAELNGMVTGDHIIIMFEEQMAGIRLTMLAALLNKANAQLDATDGIQYWNGTDYANLTFNDGTRPPDGVGGFENNGFGQSGLLSWDAPTDEESQTLFGSFGYAYKLSVDATLTASTTIIDLCTGIPALTKKIQPFAFSAPYQNRVMLGGLDSSIEGNRMDFCVSNAPDAWNGIESSENGLQSLYYGGVEPLRAATQLYNRFGANVFAMLLVLKDTEVYVLNGTGPSNYTIFPVSQSVGCPAPLTLATAEVGFELGKGITRNVAIWLSHYGPMMFDGAMLSPIKGINNYFDPNESEYIEWDVMSRARGWVDQTYKEYNLLIPSQSGASDNNVWLVYDLIRRKWFKKDTGAAETPQCGFNVMDTNTGEQKVYGGIDTGYMIEMEDGTSWNSTFGDGTDGAGIEQKIKTGDFFPSDNIWDFTILRKLKILCKKLPASASATTLQIVSWNNAAESGSNVIFQDSDASAGINVDFTDMDVDSDNINETEWTSASAGTVNLSLNIGQTRIIRLIQDLNTQGWVHAYEFTVTTTDAIKGWQPLIWGIQFYVSRKDNKATQ